MQFLVNSQLFGSVSFQIFASAAGNVLRWRAGEMSRENVLHSWLATSISPVTSARILGYNPPPGDNSPGDNFPTENTLGGNPPLRLGVLTLIDQRRGVLTLTLTLTLTDPRSGELYENTGINAHC